MNQTSNKPAIRREATGPVRLHGVLVQVFGAGVLLIGESGIGKSECALDLITRGHRIVADDAVDILGTPAGLIGTAPEITRDLLEIRGLGIIKVSRTFGTDAFSQSGRVDLCVELTRNADGERVENFAHEKEITGTVLPKFSLPVSPGRNLAVLVETAARLFLRRHNGATAGDVLLADHKLTEYLAGSDASYAQK